MMTTSILRPLFLFTLSASLLACGPERAPHSQSTQPTQPKQTRAPNAPDAARAQQAAKQCQSAQKTALDCELGCAPSPEQLKSCFQRCEAPLKAAESACIGEGAVNAAGCDAASEVADRCVDGCLPAKSLSCLKGCEAKHEAADLACKDTACGLLSEALRVCELEHQGETPELSEAEAKALEAELTAAADTVPEVPGEAGKEAPPELSEAEAKALEAELAAAADTVPEVPSEDAKTPVEPETEPEVEGPSDPGVLSCEPIAQAMFVTCLGMVDLPESPWAAMFGEENAPEAGDDR